MVVATGKPVPNRRNRRVNNPVNRPQPTVGIAVLGVNIPAPPSSVLSLEFDQPVILKGLPNYTTDVSGTTLIDAQLTSPSTLQLTFDNDISGATVIHIPYEEPAVRNASGGFVMPSGILV